MFTATSRIYARVDEDAHTSIINDVRLRRLRNAKTHQENFPNPKRQSVGSIVLARAKLSFIGLLRSPFEHPKLSWSSGKTPRDQNIDLARGLACILLVVYHVVGSPQTGIQVAGDSSWRFFADLCVYIRMPLFAFIAGFVYALRPFSADVWKGFLTGKARRLLLPMLIVGTAFAIVQSTVQSTNFNQNFSPRDWTTLHIIPVAHYWFLEALFIIFVVVAVLEYINALRDRPVFYIVLASAIVVQLTIVLPHYFAINGAVYLLPYFLAGLAVHRFNIRGMHLVLSAAIISILGLGYTAITLLGSYPVPARESLISLLIGIAASYALVHIGWKSRTVSFIGANAFAIFLFHPFFTASTRMLLKSLNVSDVTMLVVCSTIAGIVGSIVVGWLALRFSWTRTALLGESLTQPKRMIGRPLSKQSTVAAGW